MFGAVCTYKHVTAPVASNYSEHPQVSVVQIWTNCSKFDNLTLVASSLFFTTLCV